jgi:DNA-directed RNA polymerase subunit beta'
MVLGTYYLTLEKPGDKGEGKCFKSTNEAYLAYENKEITLHARIKVRRHGFDLEGNPITRMIDCTMGRLLFNEIILQDLGFVDRTKEENLLKLEIDFQVGKKQLKQILDKCINTHGATKTAEMLDEIKALGYKFSTRGALTVSVSDMTVPPEKPQILADAEKQVEMITKKYRRGMLTEEERYKAVVKTWFEADDLLTDKLITGLDRYNNIFMMADSGARGSNQQIKQLAGMRGLMADTSGRTIELPIKSNFREGLDVLEYFISAHGARKGLSDTALRTADSGYLTRRLVDVSQDLIIRETDCCEGTKEIPGMVVEAIMDGQEVIESLEERITGRTAAEDLVDPVSGEMIVPANHMITPKRAAMVIAAGYTKVRIRTMLTCKSTIGACARCYGANLATGQAVQVGEAIGIIAAQSIGEPGTQLTMRTFHAGGVAGDDITQGLPRVEELFEARKPKGLAIITEFGGVVEIKDTKKKREVVVTNKETGETKAYLIPYGSRIKVQNGQVLEAGDELTEGSVNPHDILKIKGIRAVQDYMIREVQRVYRLQGVDINDKHVEVIVRQMLKKIRIEDNGDSDYLPGTLVNILEFNKTNEELIAEGKEPATGEQVMLGITKASLATDSFLSAASFQETTKVLTDAAIKGKVDPLVGIKENVLLGKLIPAGTGMKTYRNVKLSTDVEENLMFDEIDLDDELEFSEEGMEEI